MSHNDLPVLPIWPRWRLEKHLGTGANGQVYKAINQDVDIQSAIKIIPVPGENENIQRDHLGQPDEVYYESLKNSKLREITLLQDLLGHNNVVTLQDVAVHKRENRFGWDIYIRMELLIPLNVSENHTPDRVIKLGLDICRALVYCQEHNIVHRDVKPSNIFENKDGVYKLGDFGEGRRIGGENLSLTTRGTPLYIAPELKDSNLPPSLNPHQVDIYSLGITLYQLLNNGFIPFQTENTNENQEAAFITRHKGLPLPPPANSPNEKMTQAVLRACAYNPLDRYELANDFYQDILQAKQEIEAALEEERLKRREQEKNDLAESISPHISPKQEYSYRTLEEGGVEITGYSGSQTKLELPEAIDDRPLLSIGERAFQNSRELEEITLPNCLKKLNNFAFAGCTNLERVNISLENELEEIGIGAFLNCQNLQEIELPNNLQTIQQQAFQNCISLEYVDFPTSVKTLGRLAFANCCKLKTAILPYRLTEKATYGITSLGRQVFKDCSELKTAIVPWLTQGLFQDCINLAELRIKKRSDCPYEEALKGCTSIREIRYPLGFTTEETETLWEKSCLPAQSPCRKSEI